MFASAALESTPVMLSHQVTGTYLQVHGYHDNIGYAVQTWNQDPPTYGHKWLLEPNNDGTHRIKSFQHHHCLTADASTAALPTLASDEQGTNTLQNWHLVHREIDSHTYGLVSEAHRRYALGPQGNVQTNERYVVLTRMYGGYPLLSQLWRIFPAGD